MAILSLIALSRVRFGVPAEELKAIVEAQNAAPPPNLMTAARNVMTQLGARAAAPAPPPPRPAGPIRPPAPAANSGSPREARLTALDPIDPIPTEYTLLKDEVSLGRGEDNDVVIPHASVSRAHARLLRRGGSYELTDLNSTNGSYVNNQPVTGVARIASGSEVRFGDIRFTLRF
jgi:hypothetical protein